MLCWQPSWCSTLTAMLTRGCAHANLPAVAVSASADSGPDTERQRSTQAIPGHDYDEKTRDVLPSPPRRRRRRAHSPGLRCSGHAAAPFPRAVPPHRHGSFGRPLHLAPKLLRLKPRFGRRMSRQPSLPKIAVAGFWSAALAIRNPGSISDDLASAVNSPPRTHHHDPPLGCCLPRSIVS
ncbi:hypothetical protein DPSP01_006990 [Paraphaeosphaeria sporulosa]|uniref:Secreted protein n=1 Tax=Paraphaeosphaeria sporulosa TaxID=1460663 RepID=A0A177CI41_9PLEO|nr:uncharacterized protein CC84DRAFT_610478 [Paraphaeosphaeria sporulosa]OAG06652.1 hypothetical protein CC84DRAFT_610478 [Paraphaeosphaeria sporulosa]